ncbi:MAG: hypothetical protein MZV64_60190 [Ignavibacteriales bacterium]|nr:hypothetical protein [Ignavibacteriales bacterium]
MFWSIWAGCLPLGRGGKRHPDRRPGLSASGSDRCDRSLAACLPKKTYDPAHPPHVAPAGAGFFLLPYGRLDLGVF